MSMLWKEEEKLYSKKYKKEESMSKEQKSTGNYCVICKERKAGYVRNSHPVCSGCLNGRINLEDMFFPFQLKDQLSSISVKGFHPSPLPSSDLIG